MVSGRKTYLVGWCWSPGPVLVGGGGAGHSEVQEDRSDIFTLLLDRIEVEKESSLKGVESIGVRFWVPSSV